MSNKTASVAYLVGLLLAVATFHLQPADGANILGLFTSQSPSHQIVHLSVLKTLAERGHNVTAVVMQEPKVKHPAMKIINIPPTDEQQQSFDKIVASMATKKQNVFGTLLTMLQSTKIFKDIQMGALKDKRFTDLYNGDNKFDLVIMGFFFNEYQLAVAARFKCPVIVSWTSQPNEFLNQLVGNPGQMAYVPSFDVKAGQVMDFTARVKNLFANMMFKVYGFLMNYFLGDSYYDLLPSEGNFPSLEEMRRNVSLLFLNSHTISEGPIQPLVPAAIEIGGIQIKDKPDPLPQDIAEFLNASKPHGAILFSLGSNVKSSDLKPDTAKIIFETLSGLKQHIIWKWDDLEHIPGKAKNILYKKWLPQDDILAHPNLKLFITHAGKGGVAESQYHGVPMVAIPMFGDQDSNAFKLVELGFGLQVDITTLEGATLKEKLLEVLENPKYRENVQTFSQLYRDRPLAARESVIYWTEYVLRYHGAKHMQSPLVYLNAWQRNSIDVILFLLLVAYVSWRVVKLVVKSVCKLLFKKSPKQTNKKKRE